MNITDINIYFISLLTAVLTSLITIVILFIIINKTVKKRHENQKQFLDESLIIELAKSKSIDHLFLHIFSKHNFITYIDKLNNNFINRHTSYHRGYKTIGELIIYQNKVYFPLGYNYSTKEQRKLNYIVSPLYEILNEQHKILEDVELLASVCKSEKYKMFFNNILVNNKVIDEFIIKRDNFYLDLSKQEFKILEPTKPIDPIQIGENSFQFKRLNYSEITTELKEIFYKQYYNKNDTPDYTHEQFDLFIKGELFTKVRVYDENKISFLKDRLNCYNSYDIIKNLFLNSFEI